MRTLWEDFPSQQPYVRYSQTLEYGKKDLEVRLKEVEAMAMVLRNPYVLDEERFSVVQTSVEVTEPSPPGQVVRTSCS